MNDGSGEQTITAKNIMLLAVVSLSLVERGVPTPKSEPSPNSTTYTVKVWSLLFTWPDVFYVL